MINYVKKIKDLVSEKAGMDPAEIKDESYFEDDLNLGELEVAEIVEELEDTYSISLSEYEEMETVGDLITAVSENLE
uniref:Acyl carrier protein n=1 Tax=candidate division WWE3 bacterium TaxID=2053526 RepID=A0A7C4XNZ8_UNCKA